MITAIWGFLTAYIFTSVFFSFLSVVLFIMVIVGWWRIFTKAGKSRRFRRSTSGRAASLPEGDSRIGRCRYFFLGAMLYYRKRGKEGTPPGASKGYTAL